MRLLLRSTLFQVSNLIIPDKIGFTIGHQLRKPLRSYFEIYSIFRHQSVDKLYCRSIDVAG